MYIDKKYLYKYKIYISQNYIYIDRHFNNIASIPVGYDNIAYMYILVNYVLFYQSILWLLYSNNKINPINSVEIGRTSWIQMLAE